MESLISSETSQVAATSKPLNPTSDARTTAMFCQWVDYLPSQIGGSAKLKRGSIETSEKDLTETNETGDGEDYDDDDNNKDMADWPDSSSLLDGGYQLLPPALLIDHDPIIQQELLLMSGNGSICACGGSDVCCGDGTTSTAAWFSDGSSVAPEMFALNLEELLEQRRHKLAASMQASQRTRLFLEPHFKQRAGLANVLQQIERSSWTIHRHLLANSHDSSPFSSSSSTSSASQLTSQTHHHHCNSPIHDSTSSNAHSSVLSSPHNDESISRVMDEADLEDHFSKVVDLTGVCLLPSLSEDEEMDTDDVDDFADRVLAEHHDDDDMEEDEFLL